MGGGGGVGYEAVMALVDRVVSRRRGIVGERWWKRERRRVLGATVEEVVEKRRMEMEIGRRRKRRIEMRDGKVVARLELGVGAGCSGGAGMQGSSPVVAAGAVLQHQLARAPVWRSDVQPRNSGREHQ